VTLPLPLRNRLADLILEALHESTGLDEAFRNDVFQRIDELANRASTVQDLGEGYLGVIRDLELWLRRPSEAQHQRSIERAREFIHQHLGEPISR